MRYRRLGRTGLQVSELGYGAARGAAQDPAGFIATVHACLDAGVNFIDSAAGYDGGQSEAVLGEALIGRDEVIVETKYCPYESYRVGAAYVGCPEALVASAEESLRRLRRDRLDIFLAHGVRTLASLESFMADGCYEAMVRLREQGKVRFIGLSELSEGDGTHAVLQRAVPSGAFDVAMLTLNFMLQTAEESVLPLCARHDVGAVVMMPLNQPSGGAGLTSLPAALELIRRGITSGQLPAEPPWTDPDVLGFLEPWPIPEAAIRYVLAHEVSACCVGMRSPERLQANLRALDPPYLDAERHRRLHELFGRIREQVR